MDRGFVYLFFQVWSKSRNFKVFCRKAHHICKMLPFPWARFSFVCVCMCVTWGRARVYLQPSPFQAAAASILPGSPLHTYLSANNHSPTPTPSGLVAGVQSLSCVRLFATPWTAARQASLFIIGRFFTTETPGKPNSLSSRCESTCFCSLFLKCLCLVSAMLETLGPKESEG